MKLFKAELRFKRKRAGRYGVDVIDLGKASKHFVVADLVEWQLGRPQPSLVDSI